MIKLQIQVSPLPNVDGKAPTTITDGNAVGENANFQELVSMALAVTLFAKTKDVALAALKEALDITEKHNRPWECVLEDGVEMGSTEAVMA